MKYLKTLPVSAAEAINKAAFKRRNPNFAQLQADRAAANTHPNLHYPPASELLEYMDCEMTVDVAGDQAEIHVPDDHAQYFTAAQRAQMSDVATLEVPE